MVLFLNINGIVVWWFADPGGDYTATTTTPQATPCCKPMTSSTVYVYTSPTIRASIT